jgi:hypothetical protein
MGITGEHLIYGDVSRLKKFFDERCPEVRPFCSGVSCRGSRAKNEYNGSTRRILELLLNILA